MLQMFVDCFCDLHHLYTIESQNTMFLLQIFLLSIIYKRCSLYKTRASFHSFHLSTSILCLGTLFFILSMAGSDDKFQLLWGVYAMLLRHWGRPHLYFINIVSVLSKLCRSFLPLHIFFYLLGLCVILFFKQHLNKSHRATLDWERQKNLFQQGNLNSSHIGIYWYICVYIWMKLNTSSVAMAVACSYAELHFALLHNTPPMSSSTHIPRSSPHQIPQWNAAPSLVQVSWI